MKKVNLVVLLVVVVLVCGCATYYSGSDGTRQVTNDKLAGRQLNQLAPGNPGIEPYPGAITQQTIQQIVAMPNIGDATKAAMIMELTRQAEENRKETAQVIGNGYYGYSGYAGNAIGSGLYFGAVTNVWQDYVCEIFVDDESKGFLSPDNNAPNKYTFFYLPPGNHHFQATRWQDGALVADKDFEVDQVRNDVIFRFPVGSDSRKIDWGVNF